MAVSRCLMVWAWTRLRASTNGLTVQVVGSVTKQFFFFNFFSFLGPRMKIKKIIHIG